ncbi:delta 9-fatty acid desaturase protein [Cylindrobasidium torrendii FP15055 ss-10]|uniref:Acyl-CoA desaturase n=1 Tax=Cylindrobasidium torrendii FP15055 ss-10 TaxID=1314674 RepID=A0A0D7BPF7_9AGAR|nr:delta 9-fatty acid desaturase protein [Cylindrobasidium torrendii FP15055 ss-10]
MAKPTADQSVPVDLNVPENYVLHTLTNTKPLPPIKLSNLHNELQWLSVIILTTIPTLAIVGVYHTTLKWQTFVWAFAFYFFSGLGITAGYHRLWAHRSYNASKFLEYVLVIAGASAVQGSVHWWSRGHRAHHRYTDTDLDPYNAHRGFWYSHIGWMLLKPRRKPGVADVSDLKKNKVIMWQHRWYLPLIITTTFVLPTAVAHYGWNDAWGGLVYAGLVRLTFVHHSTFCVNSLAHWIGESPFDDKHTPKNHMLTAFVTVGEGYHNFHHQFPMDYRNAIRWYQYDPTKWFIWTMSKLGLAWQLKTFPENEIQKGVLTMHMKKLRDMQEKLTWPESTAHLPVVTYESWQEQSAKRPLVLISGFIHDLSGFLEEHPGGAHLVKRFIGKDATTAFFGGVYDHSNAAHNLLAMKRVGVLSGGHPHILDIARTVPPSQRLKVARYEELKRDVDYGSTTAVEDEDDSEDLVVTRKLKLRY